ncbi:MAG: type VI secretion system ATPase TssH [Candidatus Eisenbacteria bacterium]|nr:type VI secretion system ATPase TssH [Candidatus Eisenbacteria bacterium]
MLDVDIKGLFHKLNPYSRKAMEGAVGLCVSRTHYEVSVDHVLAAFLDDPNGDAAHVMRHFGVNPAPLLGDLQRGLEKMKSGNSGRPVFSPRLLEWISDAWLWGSVEFGDTAVRSGMLFSVLAMHPDRYTAVDLDRYFEAVKLDELKRDFYRIVGGSREAAQAADAAAAEGKPGLPGRPVEETAIGRFMIDFTEKARKGEIDPVFGRDAEIRQMIDILARRRKNNPIVVGEPGVGKTAVVEGLALRIVKGDVPDILRNVRLLSLDLGLLQAGAGVKGEFENRLKSVITEVKASPTPVVTFIDEAHTLIGAGGSAGTSDAANLLKPALARGELRTIAATTWSEYKKYFEKDAALERRFQVVKLDEPSPEVAIEMMRGLREKYEVAHKVRILEEAVEAAAVLSSRYISGRQLPDKAVDLLDTAAARVKIAQATVPESLDDLERRLQGLGREREAILREQSLGQRDGSRRLVELEAEIAKKETDRDALTARWTKEKEWVGKILALRNQLDPSFAPPAPKPAEGEPAPAEASALSAEERTRVQAELDTLQKELREFQGFEPLVPVEVDTRLVAQVVGSWTGIPVGKMMKDDAALTLIFKERLAERIKGQDQALEAVDRGLRAAKAGLKNPKTPIGVFLFVGPSGVGKTETAISVADLMFGGERFVTTINMSEFQEKHTVSRLVGSPPGYVGYGEGGVLTEAVRQRPYSVVLLDECEKADPDVLNLFYQVFDKGMLADGEGRDIDFKNTVVFLTSNLATDVIMQMCQGPVPPSTEELVNAIRPVLSKHFKPALLARMEIVPYFPLRGENLKSIVRLKLRGITNRMKDSHKMTLDIDKKVEDVIAARCTDVDSGARNIDHIISQTLLPMMSTRLLEQMTEGPLPETMKLGIASDESFVIDFA